MKRRTVVVFMLLFTAALALAVESGVSAREDSEGQGRFTFALIGDMPYGGEGDAKFPNVITDINIDRQLSFVVHDGDFKNGSSECSDAVFFNRLDLFNRFEQPFVYIPGDNEWTDPQQSRSDAGGRRRVRGPQRREPGLAQRLVRARNRPSEPGGDGHHSSQSQLRASF